LIQSLNLFELSLQLDSKGGIIKNLSILVSLIFLFVTVNCSNESTPIYWDRGMVEISLVQTERLDFFISDEGDSGWNHYDDGDENIITLDFTVKNQSARKKLG